MPKYKFPRFSKEHIKKCMFLCKAQNSKELLRKNFKYDHMGIRDRLLLNLVIREGAKNFEGVYLGVTKMHVINRMKEFGYIVRNY